jgi:hypothetical protein
MKDLHYPIRTTAGLGVAVLLSLYASLSFYDAQTERNKASSDPYRIAAQEQRFTALKRSLPANTVLGYVSDLQQPAILSAAQYWLAPFVIVDDAGREWVLGNFTRPLDYAEFGKKRKLTLVKDFSNGVVLFRKAGS